MSVKAVGWAIEQDIANATKKLILVGICNHDGDGGSWPAKATLARYAGCSERTVIRLAQELADEGWIVIHKNAGGTANTRADRRTNLYVVNYSRGDTFCHPVNRLRGDTGRADGVTPSAQRGDIAVSPELSTNHPVEPETNISDQPTSLAGRIPFDSFWKQYPRKEGKATAEGRWSKMSDLHRQEAMDAMPAWCAYYATIDPKFIPHSSTWLNQRRWEDDPPDTPDTVIAQAPARKIGCETCDGTGWVEKPDPTLRSGVGMARCDCQTLTNPEQTDI